MKNKRSRKPAKARVGMHPPVDTAALVKQLRNRMKVSQEGLARLISSTVKSVSRWESGGRIAGKYLAELTNLSSEYGLENEAREFARLRSGEIARSVSDNRSTRRIPAWELQNIRDSISVVIHELDAIGDSEQVKAIRLRLKYIDECLTPWTGKRSSGIILPSDEFEITNPLRGRK